MKLDIKVEDTGIALDLKQFPDKAQKALKYSMRKAGREGVNDLKASSPKKYGDYSKNWSLRDKTTVGGSPSVVIHNRKTWGLTHLLEDGHQVVYMGRYTNKRSRKFPHFSGPTKKAGDNFVKYSEIALDSIK